MCRSKQALTHCSSLLPQSAWLQSASIKTNILFGLPYHHQRYQDTIAVGLALSNLFQELHWLTKECNR